MMIQYNDVSLDGIGMDGSIVNELDTLIRTGLKFRGTLLLRASA